MVTFIFLRHGLSLTNNTKRFTGHADVPLHETGRRQAIRACEYIATHFSVDRIYASDLSRAIDTAKPLSERLGLEIHTTPAFREIDVGCWAHHNFEEIESLYPTQYKAWKQDYYGAPYGDGESFEQLTKSVESALHEIADIDDGKTVLIATHGGAIRAICAKCRKVPISEIKNNPPLVPNASITIVEYENGAGNVTEYGFADYLSTTTVTNLIV